MFRFVILHSNSISVLHHSNYIAVLHQSKSIAALQHHLQLPTFSVTLTRKVDIDNVMATVSFAMSLATIKYNVKVTDSLRFVVWNYFIR
jgi:hypothetical protein